MENRYMKFRLSLLMFLQVGVFGVLSPIMSLYLIKTLGFSQNQAATVLSVAGITAFISPLIGILIADKLMSVEKLLGLCHLFAAGFMFFLSYQKTYGMVLLTYLLYMLVLGATSGFTSSIVFQHDPNPKKNFGFIRMWGSIGWIVPGWFFSYLWLNNVPETVVLERLADILTVAALASLVLALYTLTLPKSNVDLSVKKNILPVEALAVLKNKQVLFTLISIFGIGLSYEFYLFGMGPFLEQSGYDVSNIMPLMSIAQIVEVIGLGLLGVFLLKRGYKTVIMAGILFNIMRYGALAAGTSLPFVVTGIIGHGLSFAFFFNGASIYLDSKCDVKSRSDMQQIIGIATGGLGVFLGNILAGLSAELFMIPGTSEIQYSGFWIVPIILNIIILIGFIFIFKEDKSVVE